MTLVAGVCRSAQGLGGLIESHVGELVNAFRAHADFELESPHMPRYPARYRNQHGEERTYIENDGHYLSMTLRGVAFSGFMFDDFEPQGTPLAEELSSFTFYRRELCACTIECEMPMGIRAATGEETGTLSIRLELGAPLAHRLESKTVRLSLRTSERTVESAAFGDFEYALLDIQKQLPPGMFMVACINCAFSDYNPVGAGIFGCLACFRGQKDAYRAVASKDDLFDLWDSLTEFVQETHVCQEFERRKPGTGYRG
jgi:hypothetical protein